MNDSSNAISVGVIEPIPLRARLTRWGLVIIEFGAVQAAVQLLGALAGLLIVRSLSKSEYALFAIANSMQTTCNQLADGGIGIAARSIGGRVCGDRQRFGQLLNTAFGLRKLFGAAAFAVTLPLAAWMLWKNGATFWQVLGFSCTFAAGVAPLLSSTVYWLSPYLHGEFRRIQRLDLGNSLLRLALIALLASAGLDALLAISVGVVGNWVHAMIVRRWAPDHADASASPDPADRAEMIAYSIKWLPNVVFHCLQGQIALLILAFVGTANNIADLTALGRIAMLFAVFSVTFTNIFAPRFTRCQEPARLRRFYWQLVGGAIAALSPIFFLGWLLPQPLLWLLGEKYQSLTQECVWIVGAGCVSQIGAVMWTLNGSKGWIHYQSAAYIPTLLASQALAAVCLDLQNFHDLLFFNLVSATAPLPMYLCDALHGLSANRQNSNAAGASEPTRRA